MAASQDSVSAQRGRLSKLEAQAFRVLSAQELRGLDLEELTAYTWRLDRRAGTAELSDFRARLEAMTDGELLALAADFEQGKGQS